MANGFLSPSPPPISPSSPPDHKVWVLCSSLLNIIHLSSLLSHLPMTGLGDLLTPLLTHFDWFSRFLSPDFSDSGCDQRKKKLLFSIFLFDLHLPHPPFLSFCFLFLFSLLFFFYHDLSWKKNSLHPRAIDLSSLYASNANVE